MIRSVFLTSLFSVLVLLIAPAGSAQTGTLTGKISSGNELLTGAVVVIQQLNSVTTSDHEGVYELHKLPAGRYELQVRLIGYLTLVDSVEVLSDLPVRKDFLLHEDPLGLGEVVITGTRNELARYNSPVIVNTISSRTFEATQSLSIAEGLSFSPGLRVENNCQNCGFTQLRMNGLEGPYSQILINSRPVFSALAGVYGLEMLPANMVDRIEVVRGGGSVMYGGNAIAGTVNIITKDPIQNSFGVGINQSFVNLETPDRTVSLNGSLVSKKMDKGITSFGFNRVRSPWDANGDGFSEMVKMKNNTAGFDAFMNIGDRTKIKMGGYYINEFRRGGNRFDVLPHQAELTEQLKHDVLSSSFSLEHYTKNLKQKFSVYGSVQCVNRDSYYGSGGRIIQPGEELNEMDIRAQNAYGNSNDIAGVAGVQYTNELSKKILITAGTEYTANQVIDNMPGYGRIIDQHVNTSGSYAQVELRPDDKLTLMIGGRFDVVRIDADYHLDGNRYENNRALNVPVPRISAMYKIKNNLKLRASFAQGYRGPQAFDEDLHIETVGGAARFIQLDPSLVTERSNSALLSLNYDVSKGKNQISIVAEGFYTKLINPFIVSNPVELENGVSMATKRNGSGAAVTGVNLEVNAAEGKDFILQSGVTLQNAVYSEDEMIWSSAQQNDSIKPTVTGKLLRTPNMYGYFTITYNPVRRISVSCSNVLTGSMIVPHVTDHLSEYTILKTTDAFFENNLKVVYSFFTNVKSRIQMFCGVQNVFNSYQNDFDIGVRRDAGYVYGPLRPRTVFAGLKYNLN